MTPTPLPSPRLGVPQLVAVLVLLLGALLMPLAHAQGSGPDSPALLALKARGRAFPADVAAELEKRAQTLPRHGADHIQTLMEAGAHWAQARKSAGVERVEAELATAVGQPQEALASAASDFIQAKWTHRYGSSRRADRLMIEALARLPADAPLYMRVTMLELHSVIKGRLGRFDDGIRLGQMALRLAESKAPLWMRADLRGGLAYTFAQARNLARASELSQEALRLATEASDPMALFGALTVEGIVRSEMGQYDAALKAMSDAVVEARKAGATREQALSLANLADTFLRRGDFERAYANAQEAIPLARTVADDSILMLAVSNSGSALIGMGRKDEGLKMVNEALALERAAGSPSGEAEILSDLVKYLQAAGYEADAYAMAQRRRVLLDEIFKLERQQAMVQSQESFENEQREQELAELETRRRTSVEDERRETLVKQRWISAAVVGALMVVLAGLLVQRVRVTNVALARTNRQLRTQSETDPLTGLSNRRHGQHMLEARSRDGVLHGTLFMLDVDHFKRINDEYGHPFGDAVLVEVSRRLREAAREGDLVARWGGEEFLVATDAATSHDAQVLARRWLSAVDNLPVVHEDRSLEVTVSIGYAVFPLAPNAVGLGWEAALEVADAALYRAKALGRHRACGVDSVAAQDAAGVAGIVRALPQATEDGRAVVQVVIGRVDHIPQEGA